jgi:hypothetical protein
MSWKAFNFSLTCVVCQKIRKNRRGIVYLLMLVSVFLRKRLSILDILFQGRMDDQFLRDAIPGQLPGEQILEAGPLVRVGRFGDGVVVRFDLPVVLHDGRADRRHPGGGSREGTRAADQIEVQADSTRDASQCSKM